MDLEYEVVQRPKQLIVGLAVRTDNEQAMKDIPEVWDKFQDGWQEKIEHAINDDIVCAYMEYDEDHTKPYTYIIGSIVTHCDKIPEGMVCKELAGGKYTKIEIFGNYPDSLIEAWEDIWESDIERAYTTDIEVYDCHFTEENDYYFSIYLALPEDSELEVDDFEEFDEESDEDLI